MNQNAFWRQANLGKMIGRAYMSPSKLKTPEKKIKVAIEGNIASGKSTLLKKLSQFPEVEVLVEPVEEWRHIGGENLIERMYKDPKRWSYLFQSYVLVTMMDIHHKETTNPICMIERSIFSARYCFVENLHKSGMLDDVEFSCYCNWFDYIMNTNAPQLDLIVYLRTTPEVSYKRLQERNRQEECPVQLSYLQNLHDCYEKWLGKAENHGWHGETPVLVIDGNSDYSVDNMVYVHHASKVMSTLQQQVYHESVAAAR